MVLVNLTAGKQWRHRHREQTDRHTGGWRRWEKMNSVVLKHIYTTVCKTDSQYESAVQRRELDPVL